MGHSVDCEDLQSRLLIKLACPQKERTVVSLLALINICVYRYFVFRMYWEQRTRYPPVADCMPRNRFETLLRYLHLNDNATIKKRGGKDTINFLK